MIEYFALKIEITVTDRDQVSAVAKAYALFYSLKLCGWLADGTCI